MLKIFQQYLKQEFPYAQVIFRKGRGTRDHHQIIDKAREIQKNIYFCFIYYTNAFDCVNDKNCGKFLKRWEYQTTWPVPWETCMQVKKQHLEPDMEQHTSSKLEKEYI